MKKAATSILLVLFLFGLGTFAYGETTDTAVNNAGTRRAAGQAKTQSMSALKTQSQLQIAEIRQNRTEMLQLRAEARKAYSKAGQHIKELRNNPDQLTEAQIAQLQQAKASLQQVKLDLAASNGDVRIELQALKNARQQQNVDQI